MVVLPLLYLFYLHNVWAEVVSNILHESASNSSRGYQYYHEAKESGKLDAASDFNWRSWGGYSVTITEAPYAVLYGWTCSGSLIAPNWVLTAAHCGNENYFIHAGSELSKNTQEYAISSHVYHPGWSAPKSHFFDFDYLLLELAEFVPITDYTRPIAFGGFEDLNAGQPVAVSGWGHSNYVFGLTNEKSRLSERLNQVWMTVVDHSDCATRVLPYYESKFGENAGITPRMVCAEGDNGGACYGDSGGPVVANDRLVGLVSWGTHCEPILMFSNVPLVKDWIATTTGLTL